MQVSPKAVLFSSGERRKTELRGSVPQGVSLYDEHLIVSQQIRLGDHVVTEKEWSIPICDVKRNLPLLPVNVRDG